MDFPKCNGPHTDTSPNRMRNAELHNSTCKMHNCMRTTKCQIVWKVQKAQVHFQEQQLTPYAPRPQRQEREKGAEWAPGTCLIHLEREKCTWERSSYTCLQKEECTCGTSLVHLGNSWDCWVAVGERISSWGSSMSCSWGSAVCSWGEVQSFPPSVADARPTQESTLCSASSSVLATLSTQYSVLATLASLQLLDNFHFVLEPRGCTWQHTGTCNLVLCICTSLNQAGRVT